MLIEIKTPEDFNGAISEKQLITVQFSAPRCGGCKMVTPKVMQVAENEFLAVKFLNVSTEELENVCEEIGVDWFPAFRVC
ncbi:putative thioredoxin [Phytophthora cinnamomi]|uniref:putative thioredoxin n=1 Tax=Phytophthora cinnamomi TaxID=4785 RepID=UPI00355AAEB6|nr:putative thioredoxin [Phytophthora cinnamomi]